MFDSSKLVTKFTRRLTHEDSSHSRKLETDCVTRERSRVIPILQSLALQMTRPTSCNFVTTYNSEVAYYIDNIKGAQRLIQVGKVIHVSRAVQYKVL